MWPLCFVDAYSAYPKITKRVSTQYIINVGGKMMTNMRTIYKPISQHSVEWWDEINFTDNVKVGIN